MTLLVFSYSESFAGTSYVVVEGSAEYKVVHLLKTTHGTSKSIKGKILCSKLDQDCEFLFAVPTASFDSQNSNRDAHMKATVKEATHPIATISGQVSDLNHILSDQKVVVDFAGVKSTYLVNPVTFVHGKRNTLKAQLILKLSAHQIDRPSLLGASIKDEVPVQIQLTLDSLDVKSNAD